MLFCGKDMDCIEHYVRKCNRTKDWFKEIGKDKRVNKRLEDENLDMVKANRLRKLWREREKEIRKRKRITAGKTRGSKQ